MIFETKRLILRPWEETDVEELYKYASDERIGYYAGWMPHPNIEHSMHILKYVLSADGVYAVVLKETGLVVGNVHIDKQGRGIDSVGKNEAEFGCWLGVEYWGQGIIPEALECLKQYCFEILKCEKLWYVYFESNYRSKRVMEKLGFEYDHSEMLRRYDGKEFNSHFCVFTREKWFLN